jgi:adenine phosphoribosyltransferase
LIKKFKSKIKYDLILLGLEARGFLFGPIVALRLNAAFVPVRKKGKLPGKTINVEYQKEYGVVSITFVCMKFY